MRGVRNDEVIKAAEELGMSRKGFARRLKTMTMEEAKAMPKMTKKQAAKKGSHASPWRNQQLCRGSKDFRKFKY